MGEKAALQRIAAVLERGFDPEDRAVRVALGLGKAKKAAAVFLDALNGVDLDGDSLAIKDLKTTALKALKLDPKGVAHYGFIRNLVKNGLVEETKDLAPDEENWRYSVTAKAIKRLDALLASGETSAGDVKDKPKRKYTRHVTARKTGRRAEADDIDQMTIGGLAATLAEIDAQMEALTARKAAIKDRLRSIVDKLGK